MVQEQNYGIGPVCGYGAVGGRVYERHKNILKLMSSLDFSHFNIFSLDYVKSL